MDEYLLHFARKSIKRGSKSFALATRLLPKDIRNHTMLLYAWCRHCDDVVDGQTGGGRMRPVKNIEGVVRTLRALTDRAISGRPEGFPFQALAKVSRDKHLDPVYIFDHLAGYEMDATRREYRTLEDTLEYSYHVAGTVGVMMAQIMGVSRKEYFKYASDLGIAFQLTNIARDVVEDARAGRCYLPSEWLEELGLTVQDLTKPHHFATSKMLAIRLLDHADPFYASAKSGLSFLPTDCLWGISSALAVYADIGLAVRQASPERWAARVSTGFARKLWLICKSFVHYKAFARYRTDPADRSTLWTPYVLSSHTSEGYFEVDGSAEVVNR